MPSYTMRSSLAVALVCLTVFSVGSTQGQEASFSTIAEAIQSNPNLSYLLAAVQAAGLSGVVTDPATAYTVLAPDNNAFTEALSALEIDVNTFLADESLSSILAYHFIPEAALSTDLEAGATLTTLLGSNLTVSIEGEEVTFAGANNNATVISADNLAGQSVIHVIDSVLIPSEELEGAAPAQAPNLATAQQTIADAEAAAGNETPPESGRKLLRA